MDDFIPFRGVMVNVNTILRHRKPYQVQDIPPPAELTVFGASRPPQVFNDVNRMIFGLSRPPQAVQQRSTTLDLSGTLQNTNDDTLIIPVRLQNISDDVFTPLDHFPARVQNTAAGGSKHLLRSPRRGGEHVPRDRPEGSDDFSERKAR